MSRDTFLGLLLAIFLGLAVAAFVPWAGRARIAWARVMLGYLVGLGVGLLCYFVLPFGAGSIEGRHDFQLRFFLALAITLSLGGLVARVGARPGRYGPVALFGYLGVLTPPIVLTLFIFIACAGEEQCLS